MNNGHINEAKLNKYIKIEMERKKKCMRARDMLLKRFVKRIRLIC